MSPIKSRKHLHPRQPTTVSLAVAGALMLPWAAHAQQTQLPGVEVTATQDAPYKADRASSAKYSQPLVDTPQSITIIKKQLMDEQGATNLTEALRNTPGVGAFYLGENGSTSTGDAVYMRGFDSSSAIFVDNVRDLGSVTRDMFNIQQVEVLKGPAGTDNGRGSPTGSINLVTKQPELVNTFNASTAYGSSNQKRATADLNRVIDESNGTAFRLNLMKQESGVPGRHLVENNRWGVAPSFAWGLNSPTRVYLDFLHVKQNNVPDGGVPTVGLPGYSSGSALSALSRVPSSNFYGQATDFDSNQTDMYTVRVEHDFSQTVKLQNTTRYEKTSQDYLLTSFTTPTLAGTLTRSGNRKNQTNEILTNQTNVTVDLQTGGIRHTLVGGVELTQEKQHALAYTAVGTLPVADLYAPDPYAAAPTASSLYDVTGSTEGKTDTASAYLFDTLRFNEQWGLTAGARVDHYRTSFITEGATPSNLATSGNLYNWKLAGTYKPTTNSSVYVLYATSQQPPGGSNFALSTTASSAANASYQPQRTKTAEIGTKWDVLDKKLALTAALYDTKVENEVEADGVGGYVQTGKKSVKGIELGIAGDITRNWSVSAGYTYMKTNVDAGSVVTSSGDPGLAYTPRQAFTSWTTYRMPQGFTLGGGLRYVGSLQRGSDRDATLINPQYTDGYWVADAMASYIVSKNLTLQVNVYNLFNKDYVAAINKSGYRYTPGTPRSALLTANIKF